jgi:hypothetical protein
VKREPEALEARASNLLDIINGLQGNLNGIKTHLCKVLYSDFMVAILNIM